MEKLSMEELEKLREKKLAERDERIQNITSLIIKLCLCCWRLPFR